MYKARILKNLKEHHGKWVNLYCTTKGLEQVHYEECLSDLILEGRVERTSIHIGTDKFGRSQSGKLYRLGTSEFFSGNSLLSVVK